jgi:hypothetical protein
MIELSIDRITRIAIVLGVIGVLIAFGLRGARDATGFFVGAGLSLITVRSWFKLADSIGSSGKLPATGSVLFLVVRYLLIAGAVYATINVLRSSPAVLVMGLLVSFFAVVLELLFGLSVSKKS